MSQIPSIHWIFLGFVFTCTILGVIALPYSSYMVALAFASAASILIWLPLAIAFAWARNKIAESSIHNERIRRCAYILSRLRDVVLLTFGFFLAAPTRLLPIEYAGVFAAGAILIGHLAFIGCVANWLVLRSLDNSAEEDANARHFTKTG